MMKTLKANSKRDESHASPASHTSHHPSLSPSPSTSTLHLSLALPLAAALALLAGCATKSRHIDIAGAYVNQSGTVAVGSIEVQSAPEGVESAMVAYEDDTSWFSDEKKHKIRILLTGTNSTASAGEIVKDICTAFTVTATVLKCDPCKCGKREPEDKPEEPTPSIDEI